jgi:phosphoribosylaminoimidazolecarboxamide formyltransferase/IMP cyclohydrolase
MAQALISVFDKRNVVELSMTLVECGISIISTGGTAKKLTDEGVKNIPVCRISCS